MTLMEKIQKIRRSILEDDFKNLNKEQKLAVFNDATSLLVLAGAGSGKTSVIVNKIAYLMQYGNTYNAIPREAILSEENLSYLDTCLKDSSKRSEKRFLDLMRESPYSSHNLLAITFTNKAAGELRERIGKKFDCDMSDFWALTFHSLAVRLLRQFSEYIPFNKYFSIYDEQDSIKLIEDISKRTHLCEDYTPRHLKNIISNAKTEYCLPDQLSVRHGGTKSDLDDIRELYRIYQKELQNSNAMDFDDLILYAVKMISENEPVAKAINKRFKYVLVDEYQDTNPLQCRFVSLISKGGKLCVVGDDDQSIYRFTGADPTNILKFGDEDDATEVIKLEQNYRSTETILDAANAVIEHNKKRRGKVLWSKNGIGAKIECHHVASQFEEGNLISDVINRGILSGKKYSDYAVLYRTHAQSNTIETALRSNGIPYKVYGSLSFYKRKEIQDMIAYLSLICNHNDYTRMLRIINEPKRGIGQATIEKIRLISDNNGISFFEVMKNCREYPELSRVGGNLESFANLIDKYTDLSNTMQISELFERLYSDCGYDEMLQKTCTADEYRNKKQNVMELLSNIKQYEMDSDSPDLHEFLEMISLISSIDDMKDDDDVVSLMTMHCSKGLEFDTVFIAGFEENLFPSSKAVTEDDMEEERRLCYVSITRAKTKLYIIYTSSRMLYGYVNKYPPSRFLKEIPDQYLSMHTYREKLDDMLRARTTYHYHYDISKSPVFAKTEIEKKEKHNDGKVYKVGQKVRHKTFGDGEIISVLAMSSDAMLEIRFDVGVKKLMANYAKLEIIE